MVLSLPNNKKQYGAMERLFADPEINEIDTIYEETIL